MLENAEKIRYGVETAYQLVYQGDGRSTSAQEGLLRGAEAMERIGSISEKYAALGTRLRELYYAAQDVGYELQGILDDLDFEPELLEKIAGRLDLIDRLERKYGSTVEEVIRFGQEAASRLDELKTRDEAIAALKKEYKEADAKLRPACAELTERRKEAARGLAEEICAQL